MCSLERVLIYLCPAHCFVTMNYVYFFSLRKAWVVFMKTKRITESIALSQILSLEKVDRLSISPSLPTCTPLPAKTLTFASSGKFWRRSCQRSRSKPSCVGREKVTFIVQFLKNFTMSPNSHKWACSQAMHLLPPYVVHVHNPSFNMSKSWGEHRSYVQFFNFPVRL